MDAVSEMIEAEQKQSRGRAEAEQRQRDGVGRTVGEWHLVPNTLAAINLRTNATQKICNATFT